MEGNGGMKMKLTPNQEWFFRGDRSPYRDEWVVVVEGRVILHGPDLAALRKRFDALGIKKTPFVEFVETTPVLRV